VRPLKAHSDRRLQVLILKATRGGKSLKNGGGGAKAGKIIENRTASLQVGIPEEKKETGIVLRTRRMVTNKKYKAEKRRAVF